MTRRRRPILVLGLPRSGSTWVSAVLGTGRRVVRRHEPITQRVRRHGVDPFAHVPVDGTPHELVVAAADAGFARPRWPGRLLVKEVTPLLGGWLAARYDPVVVDLDRHPVAIALSHLERGWDPADRERDRVPGPAGELLRSMWDGLSPLQRKVAYAGAVRAWQRDQPWHDAVVAVRYEDLRSDPGTAFGELAAALGIRGIRTDVRDVGPASGPFSVATGSRTPLVPAAASDDVRRVWVRFATGTYDSDGDWH